MFIASPGDVQAERDRLVPIVEELNHWRPLTGFTLRLRGMEWFTPGRARYVQREVIDPQIGRPDVTIVIFWKRFGDPIEGAGSPTEHEYKEAVQRCHEDPQHKLLVYFKTAEIRHTDDLLQVQKIKDFRARVQDEVFYREFRTTDDFERDVRGHLSDLLRRRTTGEPAAEGLAAADAAAEAAPAFELGMRAKRAGHLLDAIKWLKLAAEQEHEQAMFNLAVALKDSGRTEEAQRWFRAGAAREDAASIYNLGLLFKGARQLTEAEREFRHAAELGDIAAMFNLGLLLKDARRPQEAETWLRRAADGGDPAAMFTLGLLLDETGQHDSAQLWLRRGAQAGDTSAMRQLAHSLDAEDRTEEATHWRQLAG